MEEYYLPHQIRFTRDDILWCFSHWDVIQEGHWPANLYVSGYTEAALTQKSITGEASYEEIQIVIAEIDARLEACDRDGAILKLYYCYSLSQKELSKLTRLKEDSIIRRIPKTLNYISSGKCRRWMPCDNCLQKCKKRGRLPITYQEWINHRRIIVPHS